MTDACIDVVIPVWNRPSETRNCLVNLINHTPGARLIMYDSGSDRDTERLLQEFADGLEERALLMRADSNIGFVKAANRGLERSEAPFLALVRNTTQVCAGWLEPLMAFFGANPEAGILQPCLNEEGEQQLLSCRGPIELSCASFAAMVMTRQVFDENGGFDEGMDGGLWCLRDYSRRACSRGLLTYRLPTPPVIFQQEPLLGSELRRQETLQKSIALFRERWGEGGSYVLHVPKGVETEVLREKLQWLVKGARHGDTYVVLLPALLYKAAMQESLDLLHENIKLLPLPRLTGDLGRRRVYQRVMAENPGILPVSAIDGLAFPWSATHLSFTELCGRIQQSYI